MSCECGQGLGRGFLFALYSMWGGGNRRKVTICTKRFNAFKSSLNFLCDVCLNTEKVTQSFGKGERKHNTCSLARGMFPFANHSFQFPIACMIKEGHFLLFLYKSFSLSQKGGFQKYRRVQTTTHFLSVAVGFPLHSAVLLVGLRKVCNKLV